MTHIAIPDYLAWPYTLRARPGFYEPTDHYATCDLCPYRSRPFGYAGYAERAVLAHMNAKHANEIPRRDR